MNHNTITRLAEIPLWIVRLIRFNNSPSLLMIRVIVCLGLPACFISCVATSPRDRAIAKARADARVDALADKREEGTPEGIAMHQQRVQNWPRLKRGMTREEVDRLMPAPRPPRLNGGSNGAPLHEYKVGLRFTYQYCPSKGRYELASWLCFARAAYPELA